MENSNNQFTTIKNDGYETAVLHNRLFMKRGDFLSDIDRYLAGGLYATVVDKPVSDCLANGYDITNDDGLIDDEVSRLKVNNALVQAITDARLSGGACIIPVIEDGLTFADPLMPERIQNIAEFRVYDATRITTTGVYETDIFSPNYNKPLFYNISNKSGNFIVHYSRVIPIAGNRLPFQRAATDIDWIGKPVTREIYKAIDRYNVALSHSSLLIEYKQQAVYKMTGMAQAIGAKQEDKVKTRIRLVDEGRSLTNTIAVDAMDSYTILDPSISGVKDIIDEFKQAICANSDVGLPMSMLFGNSRNGLASTNEGDFRQYYDNCDGIRQRQIKPALEAIIGLIASQPEFRKYTDWDIKFNPMYEPTAKEAAEIKKTEADTITSKINTLIAAKDAGLITPELAYEYIQSKGFFLVTDTADLDSNAEYTKGLLNGK